MDPMRESSPPERREKSRGGLKLKREGVAKSMQKREKIRVPVFPFKTKIGRRVASRHQEDQPLRKEKEKENPRKPISKKGLHLSKPKENIYISSKGKLSKRTTSSIASRRGGAYPSC